MSNNLKALQASSRNADIQSNLSQVFSRPPGTPNHFTVDDPYLVSANNA